MSHIFLDRGPGRLRLYLHGDLQFDAADERQYHEPLALVPVALAARRRPGHALRVLVLGGGDGLALREALRFPEVVEAHVVDRDPGVIRLGREALAGLNRDAFADPRARVHAEDARDFLARARGFDVVISDLTYPGGVADAALLDVATFRRARAALAPGGLLAVNAVSPELTPQAFGCIGTTLGAAGLSAVPYAFLLPSFVAEGYGRWGFLFASARPIGAAEIRVLSLPAGAELTPAAFLRGTLFPAPAAAAMRVAANRVDELLYYLYNAAPLSWTGPVRPLRFTPAGARVGPRLTVAQGFARWLREPAGRRSLETLLGCLPLSRRDQTRAALLDWSEHAEALFREIDLRLFVERALRRAHELPRAWVREMTRLLERLREGLPPMRELLEQAYRVFAVYLLLLLLANLFFPDNLYAKGSSSFSSSRSRGSGSSYSSSSDSSDGTAAFHFSDPATAFVPYRHRAVIGGYGPRGLAARVYDPQGREFPAQRLAVAGRPAGAAPIASLLALTAELQLLESGALAYVTDVPGYQSVLEPGRLRVLDAEGREVVALLPGRALEDDARRQLDAQVPLIEKAVLDHRRWLDWVRWASVTPPGRQAASELDQLEAMRRAVQTAQAAWRVAPPPPLVLTRPNWVPVFPGLYVEAAGPAAASRGLATATAPSVAVVTPTGDVRPRGLEPPASLTDDDRFFFHALQRHYQRGGAPWLREPLARWLAAHEGELAVRPPAPHP